MKTRTHRLAAAAAALLCLSAAVSAAGAQPAAPSYADCGDWKGRELACMEYDWVSDTKIKGVKAYIYPRTKDAFGEVWAKVNGKRVTLCARRGTSGTLVEPPVYWFDAATPPPLPPAERKEPARQLKCSSAAFKKVTLTTVIHVEFWTKQKRGARLADVHHAPARGD